MHPRDHLYEALRAALEAADREVNDYQRYRSQNRVTSFDPNFEQAQLNRAIADRDLAEGGRSYNLTVPDLVALRSLVKDELTRALPVLAQSEAEIPAVPKLKSIDSISLTAAIESRVALAVALQKRETDLVAARARLGAMLLHVIPEAMALILKARQAAGLPSPVNVVPQVLKGQNGHRIPSSVDEIEACLRDLEAQAQPDEHAALTFHDHKVAEHQKNLDDYRAKQEREAILAGMSDIDLAAARSVHQDPIEFLRERDAEATNG